MEKKRKSKKVRRIMNINSELPPDILRLILSKLPLFNLLTCRLVCKAWNNWMSTCKFDSNLFIAQISVTHTLECVDLDAKYLKGKNIVASFKLHPKWSKITIANSCNGLLCIFKRRRRRTDVAAILNPITNEYIKLPSGDPHRDQNYLYGLGFSPKTKQYKIVRYSSKDYKALVEIFAFGTSHNRCQWRPVADSSGTFTLDCHGVYFNGAIYWFGRHLQWVDDVLQYPRRNAMWRLNVEDETFEEICYPPVGVGVIVSAHCGVFNGSLYLTHFVQQGLRYHVWKMGEVGLWIRAFVVGLPPKLSDPWQTMETFHIQLIKLCEDGKILCLVHNIHLVFYDPNTKKLEKLDQEVGIKEILRVFQINSFDFHPLHNILAGDNA